jgi:hypothetical protein
MSDWSFLALKRRDGRLDGKGGTKSDWFLILA